MQPIDNIFISVARHQTESVKKLIDLDPAVLNFRDSLGNTALHLACGYKYFDIVQHLLAAGANKHIRNRYGLTPSDLLK